MIFSIPHEVNMAGNGSHWKKKNEENKTQKVQISHNSVIVLRLKHRPPGVCSHNDKLNLEERTCAKKTETSKKLYIYMCVCVCVLVSQLCLTLCDPMDYSPSDSSVHGILQSRILDWVAIPFSSKTSQPKDQSQISCITGRFFTI